MCLRGGSAAPLADDLKRTRMLSNYIISSRKKSSITSGLGTTVVSGRTLGHHLGNRLHLVNDSFLIKSIWRPHGVLSGHFLDMAFVSPLSRSGVLNEQYWVHIAGCRTIISAAIVYFYLVC
jgi:hypothetical protein